MRISIVNTKYEKLKTELESYGSAAIAFSGGVDSTFLLCAAKDVLGDKCIAVTAKSCSFPERELKEAADYAAQIGVKHIIVDSEELDIDGFASNPENRCYLCKNELFTKIKAVAAKHGIAEIAEGSNLDDNGDYRPGLQAVAEHGVKSPLRAVGLGKAEIREISRELGLPTWDKQSFACLSSRFPYGTSITAERLRQIDKAEQYLLDLGLKQVRVRHHGTLARIETDEPGFATLAELPVRRKLYAEFKRIGFVYTAIDLLGYRTGSMNEGMK
ncbi:MAG: ATP-dependent sacrificial sulfur transferase LarE [Oscillospiraceae bacterium]|jgi:uncharacterized protein|nr:ATP-dependent sacrificial sulfur transferase LarE [Oscillospiraceae bacterium]